MYDLEDSLHANDVSNSMIFSFYSEGSCIYDLCVPFIGNPRNSFVCQRKHSEHKECNHQCDISSLYV